MRRLSRGRTGIYLESICMTIYTIALRVREPGRCVLPPGPPGHKRGDGAAGHRPCHGPECLAVEAMGIPLPILLGE